MKTDISSENNKLVSALYVRVSTGRQEQEATIESQLDEVKKRVIDDGNILPPENIFIDDGWSGEMIARPALDQMRDSAKEGKFQAIYVYDRGRLSRVFYHQELIIGEFRDNDIKFISIHDIDAVTPEERVLQSMQGVFHEYERVKIIERMRRGKLYKARNGVIINGQALYGYRIIRTDLKEPAIYTIDEDESKTVKLIWNWFVNDRVSINGIKKKLYDNGIKPRKRKSLFWTKGPIVRILKCDTYFTGQAYYNKSESIVAKNPMKEVKYKKVKKTSRKMRLREDWIAFNVPKIIESIDMYEKAQKILDFNQKYACKRKKYDYLLSGLIYCSCGQRRSGDGSNNYGHYYYRCIDRIRNHPYPKKCKACGINAPLLDEIVWQEVKKHISNYSLIRKYAEKWVKSLSGVNNEDKAEKERLNRELIKINETETRFSKAYGTGIIDFDKFQELMKTTKKEKNLINKQLTVLANKSVEVTFQIEVDELVKEAIEVINNLDLTNKFKIIRDIIQKVIVSERSGAEVWIHLPLPATTTEKLGYEPQSRTSRVT